MVGAMLVLFINSRVKHSTEDQILYLIQGETEISAIGQQSLKAFGADCALVLGCGIADAETPSPMLKDRLDAGIALYRYGIVPKLLLSGDNGQENHNELHVMLKYTREAGVPEEDIFLRSCGIFDLRFGLSRAGYFCGIAHYHRHTAISRISGTVSGGQAGARGGRRRFGSGDLFRAELPRGAGNPGEK